MFFIILLVETVLSMGNAFADEPFELERLLALVIAFTGTVALWWCYFQRAEVVGAQAFEAEEEAGAAGLWGTLTLALILLGLIAIAVGDQMAIADPGGDTTLGSRSSRSAGPRCSCSLRSSSWVGRSGASRYRGRWEWRRSRSSRSRSRRSP